MFPIRLSLLISLSSILALPLTNGCVPLQANSSATWEAIAQLNYDELQQVAQAVTVRVMAGKNRGSGVLVAQAGSDYTVVTNAHVLTAGEPYQIQTPDGTLHEATLLTESEAEDLALLQFRSTQEYTIAEIHFEQPAEGEQVLAAGFPYDGEQLQLRDGEVTLVSEQPIEGGYSIGYTSDIQQGMSGGAILNSQGKLIGINGKMAHAILDRAYWYSDGSRPTAEQLQQMREVAWGVPIEAIMSLVPQLEAPAQNLTGVAAQVNDIAKQITVLIEAPQGHGSGVIIARQGDTYTVLTAAHVVKGQNPYTIVTPNEREYAVASEAVAVLPGADLAVVRFTSNQNYQVATLGNYSTEVFGKSWIFLSGFPGGSSQPQRRFTAGTVFSREASASAAVNLDSLTEVNGYGLVYSNLSQGGMSGGAVLDSRGRLIGIHAAAEGETVLQETGLAQFNLGRSLGVPITTFLGVAERANVNPQQLAIETDRPTKLDQAEVEAIQDLFVLDTLSDAATATDWLDYGNQLWRTERYKEAVSAIDRAIALQPDFYQAYFVKGVALGSQEKAEEAIAAYTKALEINPRFYEAWRNRSFRYYLSNQHEQALADIEQAISYQPHDWTLYLDKSRILVESYIRPDAEFYLNRAAIGEAVAAANRALALNQDSPMVYLGRGLAYAGQGELNRALADYNRALEINPENWLAYIARGKVYRDLNNPQRAIADYSRALEIDPQYYDTYWVRASFYWELEQYDQAFADLKQAIAVDPQRTEAYEMQGLWHRQLEDYEQAIAAYTQLMAVDPQSRVAYDGRGSAYIALEEYEQAIADFTRALERAPESANAYLYREAESLPEYLRNLSVQENADVESHRQRGYAYFITQKFDGAIADFTAAIQINPEDITLYSLRGGIYQFSEKYEEALADYTQAIELSEKYMARAQPALRESLADILASGYTSRARLYAQLAEYEQAIADYTKVLDINPEDAEAYFHRGNAYYRQGEYQAALSDYQAAIAQAEDFLAAYVNIGIVKYETGNIDEAIAQWQRAVAMDSEAAEPQLALAVAYYTQGNQEQGLAMARAALAKDERLADVEFLRGNLWGDRLIASVQTLLTDSRLAVSEQKESNLTTAWRRFLRSLKSAVL